MSMNLGHKVFLLFALAISIFYPADDASAQANLETFGQNRIQYRKFAWKYFETEHFRIYHYDAAGRQLARYVAEQVENDIKVVERKMGGEFPNRFKIILYNSYDDYRQTNVGRKSDSQLQNISAGTVDLVGDKLVVYFTGVHTDLRRQTRAGMSRVVMEHMLFGDSFREMVKNAILMNLPTWTVNGFTSYLIDGWDTESNTDWKNMLEAYPNKNFHELAEKDPELAGKAFWKYISDKYGDNTMKSVLYTMQLKSSLSQGIKMSLGMKVQAAYDSTLAFYRAIYEHDAIAQEEPTDKDKLIEFNIPKDNGIIRNIKVTPRGNDVAYVLWKNGEYKVYIQKTNDEQERSLILDGGRLDYNEVPDPDYPLLAWSNNGYKLAIVYKKGRQTRLRIYDALKAKIINSVIPPNRFDRVLGMSFIEDDTKLLFSATKKSQTDLYEFTIRGSRMTNITNDAWDDVQPWYVSGGSRKGILFLSNRPEPNLEVPIDVNELPVGPMNVFFYNTTTKRKELLQMSHVKQGTVSQPIQYGSDNYAYLYDINGIRNRFVVVMGRDSRNMDSAYAVPVTNYSHNIISHQYNPASNQVADVLQVGDKYKVYFRPMQIPGVNATEKLLVPTSLSQSELKKKGPPVSSAVPVKVPDPYVESAPPVKKEPALKKGNAFQSEFEESAGSPGAEFEPVPNMDKAVQKLAPVEEDEEEVAAKAEAAIAESNVEVAPPVVAPPVVATPADSSYVKMKAKPYRLGFKPERFTVRLDNSVLFNKYQSAGQNGNQWANQPLGALATISLNDLMEDHRVTGGVRLPINFSGMTYFMQYENFKRRLDWGVLYLRQQSYFSDIVTYVDQSGQPIGQREELFKGISTILQGNLSYPIDRIRSVRMTVGLREDKLNLKAQDIYGLGESVDPDMNKQYWATQRLEYVFDNTTSPTMNIYTGFRYKFFAEYMYQLNNANGGFYNLGLDIRYYHKLFKNFIWASRLAGAHSAGNKKILYLVGGVDNWMFAKYSDYVPVRPTENYAFQALGTNLRGYPQNARNGNTYAVFNTELRLPVFATFVNRPIQSSFLRNLQLITFVDAGSAWNGLVPNADALRNDKIFGSIYSQQNPVMVTVTDYTAGVGIGFGGGLRTALLGYFLRLDVASNIEGDKPIFYFSIGTDF